MGKIKLLSLFSGIGAFEKALTNQKIEFDIYKHYTCLLYYFFKAFTS